MVIADNLAAHSLGGFFCNFSTVQKFCHFCNIRRDQLNQWKLISKITLRKENANIASIEEDPHNSPLYGLTESSILNELHYYHVTNGLPYDLVHDLFEGFAVDVVSNAIISFIREGLFELDELNNLIISFDYSESDKGRKLQFVKKTL